MIEIQNFYKAYSKKNDFVVQNVSLKIPDGTIAALIGVNGAGKSTIIKALTGFHYPTKGNVYLSFGGEVFNSSEFPEKIMESTGYVPEVSMLPPDMVVYDFLVYCAKIHNLADIKSSVEKVIKKCAISKVLNKKIKTLSKGYKQRVSFAQALIHNPENLILDEPISGLDPAQIIQLRELIQNYAKDKAVFISTHILQEVKSLCSLIFIIDGGKIIYSGSEKEILEKSGEKSLEELFLKISGGEDE